MKKHSTEEQIIGILKEVEAGMKVASSIRSKRLIQVLEQLIKERGCPMVLRSGHGPEFVSIALLQWAADRGLRNLLIEPGR